MEHSIRLLLPLIIALASAPSAHANTSWFYCYSLEWLIDASDSIVEATVIPREYMGNLNQSTATVKSVDRVLKQVEGVG